MAVRAFKTVQTIGGVLKKWSALSQKNQFSLGGGGVFNY